MAPVLLVVAAETVLVSWLTGASYGMVIYPRGWIVSLAESMPLLVCTVWVLLIRSERGAAMGAFIAVGHYAYHHRRGSRVTALIHLGSLGTSRCLVCRVLPGDGAGCFAVWSRSLHSGRVYLTTWPCYT